MERKKNYLLICLTSLLATAALLYLRPATFSAIDVLIMVGVLLVLRYGFKAARAAA